MPAALASDILTACSTILLDDEHVRWPLPELAGWLNGALAAVVMAKPSANSLSIELQLTPGSLQKLVNPDHIAILRIPRNLQGLAVVPRIGGRAIRPTERELLDAANPDWSNPTITPPRTEVRQTCFDEEVPREFYVYPPNDGTGVVEVVVSKMPAQVTPTGDPMLIASYAVAIDLPATYGLPLTDYVLYRAYAKDALGADPGRSGWHFNQFASALGIKVQVEKQTSPNTLARVNASG